jgi:iduronate 2-sulfatase
MLLSRASVAVLLLLLPALAAASPTRNVLFVAVDDMRPSIGAYNFSLAHTPNMDRMAREGLVFAQHYVQYAYCGPSRNSFMTGRRPDTTKVWEFDDHFRQSGPGTSNGIGWQTLPEYFKLRGYVTLGSGKLFHPTSPPDNDCPRSWSVEVAPYYSPECIGPANASGAQVIHAKMGSFSHFQCYKHDHFTNTGSGQT